MKFSIFSKTVLILSAVSLFTDIASEMLYPVSPLFLKSIGFSMLLIGILEGVAEAVAGYSKGYFGALSDRTGHRAIFVQIGYGLSAISRPIIGLWPIAPVVFLGRTLDRLGKGIRTAPRDAILVAESTPDIRGKVFGFHRACDTLGAAIGPTIALLYLYLRPSDYRTLFFIAFLPALAGFFLTFSLKREVNTPTPLLVNHKIGLVKFLRSSSREYKILVFGFVMLAIVNSSDVFILLKGKESGLSDTSVLGAYIFYNLLYALMALPLGSLGDRIGFKWVYVFGVALFGLVYFLLGSGVSGYAFWATMGIYATYAAANEGIAKAWLSLHVPSELKGTGLGTFQMLSTFAFLVASPLTGALWSIGGAGLPFIVIGSVAMLNVIYFVILA
jgi:MFS family permease